MRRTKNTINKLHLKKNDLVKVIAGDDKGKTGRIIAVYPSKRRVKVEGVNIVTKHRKPTSENTEGGRIQEEASITISNIMLWDEKTKTTTRIGSSTKTVKGVTSKIRVSVKTKEEIK